LCKSGYYQGALRGSCLKCPYKCKTCELNEDYEIECITCAGSFRVTNNPDCPCLDGYYDDGVNATCKKCLASCKTCVDGTECTSCEDYEALG
jgi:proprotein convertase subtilisin/kexin type 5